MSFYRSILAAVAAAAIVTPVFADDAVATQDAQAPQQVAQASTDNSAAATASTDQNAAAATDAKINLNKATAKDLMKVKGLNASKARAIVAYRKKHGDFKSVDDLSNVKGFKKINADTMKEISDQVSVD